MQARRKWETQVVLAIACNQMAAAVVEQIMLAPLPKSKFVSFFPNAIGPRRR
jgi:hypothetical protein